MGLDKVLKSSKNNSNFYITNNNSELVVQYADKPVNMGRMNDPTGSAWIKGACGDTMEIYLVIEKDKITDIKFYTDGCGVSLACGSAVTILAKGASISEVLSLSPGSIINFLKGLPKDHLHCSILAMNTLYKAIADYLLK